MKMQEAQRTVVRSGKFVESKFRIKASAKAFDILSSGLYSDKYAAIVRELSTNAVDAHIAAGTPTRPFAVHLPDIYEPWFSVRDYGPGLRYGRVRGIYTTYFESDKTDSNDVNGCLGLGSKSPFSYDDNFQVTSWHRGIVSVYTALLDEDHMPSIVRLARRRQEANEPDGLEVRVAVANVDTDKFVDAAKRIYAHFRTQPEFSMPDFKPDIPVYKLRTPMIGLLGPAPYAGYGRAPEVRSRVIMGDVAYPISSADCKNEISQMVKSGLDYGIHLYVPIGSVDMTASRESLKYTQKTVKAIAESCEHAITEVQSTFIAEIAAAPTRWAARQLYYKLTNSLPWAGQMPGIDWNGQRITTKIDKKLIGPFKEITRVVKSFRYPYKPLDTPRLEVKAHTEDVYGVDDPPTVYIADMPQYNNAATLRDMGTKNLENAWLFDQPAPMDFFASEGLLDKIVLCSSVPKAPMKPRAVKAKQEKALFHELSRGGQWSMKAAEVDITAGGVYVERIRDTIVSPLNKHPGASFHPTTSRFTNMLSCIEALDPPFNKLYGVRTADIPRVKKKGKWRDVHDLAQDLLKAKAKSLARSLELRLAHSHNSSWAVLINKKYANDSVFGAYAKLYRAAETAKMHDNAIAAVRTLAEAFPGVVELKPAEDYGKAREAVIAVYPLLLGIHAHDKNAAALHDYIGMIDARRASAPTVITPVADKPALHMTG